ncbi:MAG TPA: hypothetical protein DCQ31_04465 [Bacteroidales bacterium]|nr:hypothetical protein [Bacteroidales bacterium]
MAITAMPMLGQCDLELKTMIKKKHAKGLLMDEKFFLIDKIEDKNPNKADYTMMLSKGTTYECIMVSSEKYQGKVAAKLLNVEVNKETGEQKIKNVLFDMQPSYYVKGVMRATFTVPETAIYYLFMPVVEGEKACTYFRLDYINMNHK